MEENQRPEPPTPRLAGYVIAILSLLLIGVSVFLLVLSRSTPEGARTEEVVVELPSGLSRLEVAKKIGQRLGWNESQAEELAGVHAQMDWAAFNNELLEILTERFDWEEDERVTFITNSSRYFSPFYDAFSGAYEPGTYTLVGDESYAMIAGLLISRVREAADEPLAVYLAERLDEGAVENIAEFVERNVSMLPDLVPMPASDMILEEQGGGVLFLRFSTSYYNAGNGPLELQADPNTRGIAGDLERNVFQRIYRTDGTYRDELVGTFLWHDPHLHYHFADFITYELEAINVSEPVPNLGEFIQKSTFCIRDMSHIELDLDNRPVEPAYQVCGKERQGISVGWADTYFYNYPDQLLNITDLPSGTYALTFTVNPEGRFEEITEENNTSSVFFELDMETRSLTITGQLPEIAPDITHIYTE